MRERRIEEAALNSWPALQQLHYDGWLLRFARGYTKRANSITPLYPSQLLPEHKIEYCEYIYQEKRLPAIFRLPSFLEGISELDQFLERRGYQHIERTFVLSMELGPGLGTEEPVLTFSNVTLTTWLSIFSQLSRSPIEKHQPHQAILERIVSRPLFAVLRLDKMPVACALGVQENELFGLFDVVTAPEQRRKGYATQLVTEMLHWARWQRATHAYLQLVSTNRNALSVYERLGFRELYSYSYRMMR